GLGQSEELVGLVRWLYKRLPQSLVVDADALNALAQHPKSLTRPGGPRILTPHPGEFARLTGQELLAPSDRESRVQEFAERLGAIVVLKGHGTVVTDGQH